MGIIRDITPENNEMETGVDVGVIKLTSDQQAGNGKENGKENGNKLGSFWDYYCEAIPV